MGGTGGEIQGVQQRTGTATRFILEKTIIQHSCAAYGNLRCCCSARTLGGVVCHPLLPEETTARGYEGTAKTPDESQRREKVVEERERSTDACERVLCVSLD